MKKNGRKTSQAKGDELLLQVLEMNPGSNAKPQKPNDEQNNDKLQAALARLAEQNPALVAEIIQKWLVEEDNRLSSKPDRFGDHPVD